MDPASRLLSSVLPTLLARAPLSREKVEFAWRTVVGPAMARATCVRLVEGGTLHVGVDGANWRREVESARPVILPRLSALLGVGVVRKLVIAEDT